MTARGGPDIRALALGLDLRRAGPDRSDLDAYLALTQELDAERVLDVGCGTGVLALLLADRGIDVAGVDPAAGSLQVARAKPGAARVRWLHGDATTLPALQVDLATMTGNAAQVFVFPQDWAATLTGVREALRPGCHFVFETRNPARRAWEEWTETTTRSTATGSGSGRGCPTPTSLGGVRHPPLHERGTPRTARPRAGHPARHRYARACAAHRAHPAGREQLHAASAAVRAVEQQMLSPLPLAHQRRLRDDLVACAAALTTAPTAEPADTDTSESGPNVLR